MDAQLQILLDMKQKAEVMLDIIEKLEKKQKSNKLSKEAKKVISKFLRCNITSPAIFKRYHEVMLLMERYAMLNKEGKDEV